MTQVKEVFTRADDPSWGRALALPGIVKSSGSIHFGAQEQFAETLSQGIGGYIEVEGRGQRYSGEGGGITRSGVRARAVVPHHELPCGCACYDNIRVRRLTQLGHMHSSLQIAVTKQSDSVEMCIPGGFDEGCDIPRGSGVKGLDVAMLSSHPVVPGGRHIAQRSSLHSIFTFHGTADLQWRHGFMQDLVDVISDSSKDRRSAR
ncbi:MAG: hypothetical protein FRX49_04928 [Trebouxia sp. A1-2]|nr:MAG: hypothetical protein FRX49_04928 [Trebouxia sp. A1-2]